MDSEFNKIKDKFQKEKQNVPGNLDWGKMQAGIFSKMDRISQEEAQKKDGKLLRRSLLLLLLIFFAGIIGWICFTQQDSPSVDQAALSTKTYVENTEAKGLIALSNPDKVLNKVSDAKISASAARYDQKEVITERLQAGVAVKKPKKALLSKEANTENLVFDKEAKLRKDQSSLNVSTDQTGGLTSTLNTSDSKEGGSRSAINASTRGREGIASLASKQYLLRWERGAMESPLFSPSSIMERKDMSKHQLGFFLGQSIWDMGYESESPEDSSFETGRVSFTAHLDYQYKLSKGFFLSTGLIYQDLQSRLDWTTDLDDYTVTLEDVVLEVRRDALTGEVEEVRGDVEVQVNAQRQVRHHNTYTLLQVPFAVGMTHSSSSLKWSYSLGGSLNLLSQNQGRILFEGELFNLEEAETELLENQFKWNGFIRTGVSYSLNKRLDLGAQLMYQRSLNNWSMEEAVRIQPQQLNISLGLLFTLE
jgi:hypothetical protein